MTTLAPLNRPSFPRQTAWPTAPVAFGLRANITSHRKRFPKNQVIVLDTTLRDGSQTPDMVLTHAQKLDVAQRLQTMGVNVIEAGFPVSSEENFAAVEAIAKTVGRDGLDPPVISAFARTVKRDMDAAWNAVKHAQYPRLHIVGTGSTIHLNNKYGTNGRSKAENLRVVESAISYARQLMGPKADIEFTPEDCTRADLKHLVDVYVTAANAGATTLNVADTLGCSLPSEYGTLVETLMTKVNNSRRLSKTKKNQLVWSVHTHNDLGLSTANALAGLRKGARQVEVTINGLGERAGNTPMSQISAVVDSHNLRSPHNGKQLFTSLDLTQLIPNSRYLAKATRIQRAPNMPVVGRNAFLHASGMHQDGEIKGQRKGGQRTYQFLDPATYGTKVSYVLNNQSGSAGVYAAANRLGFSPPATDKDRVYRAFSRVAQGKRRVHDTQLRTLMAELGYQKTPTKG